MQQLSFFLLLSLLCLSWSSCDEDNLFVGSNTQITESRELSTFSGLDISDDVQATISFGSVTSVDLTANDNILDRIRTDVSNDVLIVRLAPGNYRDVNISLDIVIPDLSFLKASDDAEITAATFLDLDELRLEASDDGEITVEGTVTELSLRSTDGAEIHAFNLTATNCEAVVMDGADAKVLVNNMLSGRVTDGGDLFYRGNPDISVSTSDGGEVINDN